MVRRHLGRTGIELSPIGFGAFKIGRNQKIKYAQSYELPTDDEVERLIGGIIDMGINYIDTAPAYGSSEERLGRVLAKFRRDDLIVSTKVGETFENGVSTHDFSPEAVRQSIERSRQRLRMETLDLVFIHSCGNDEVILECTHCAETLQDLRKAGDIRAIGFSAKTSLGEAMAMKWADALMIEIDFGDDNPPLTPGAASRSGVGVIVKKGLDSGRLDASTAIQRVLEIPGVTSMVIGGLNLDHFRENVAIANSMTSTG